MVLAVNIKSLNLLLEVDKQSIIGELQDIKALNIEGGSEGEVLERLEGSVA